VWLASFTKIIHKTVLSTFIKSLFKIYKSQPVLQIILFYIAKYMSTTKVMFLVFPSLCFTCLKD